MLCNINRKKILGPIVRRDLVETLKCRIPFTCHHAIPGFIKSPQLLIGHLTVGSMRRQQLTHLRRLPQTVGLDHRQAAHPGHLRRQIFPHIPRCFRVDQDRSFELPRERLKPGREVHRGANRCHLHLIFGSNFARHDRAERDPKSHLKLIQT